MTFQSERGRIVAPNLDDRSWQDLVNEVTALIPVYAPQWTDPGPSDPGIAIVEMFAMLVESLIYRLNRVPDKNYVAFLNLLGITRDPPSPALTYLTFTSSVPVAVPVPAGTQAQTSGSELLPAVVFETDAPATILPTNLKSAVVVGPYDTSAPTAAQLTYANAQAVVVGPPTGKLVLSLGKGQTAQVCLGFDQATAIELVLRLQLYQTLLAGQATLTCVYSAAPSAATAPPLDPNQWPDASGVVDGTQGLQHDGNVRLTAPAAWEAQRPTADGPDKPGWTKIQVVENGTAVTDSLFWIGFRIQNVSDVPISLGVDRLLFNTAPAHNVVTIPAPELLGTSNGQSLQLFGLAHCPLYSAAGGQVDLVVEVGQGTPPVWEEWEVVFDDVPAGPSHGCRVNAVTGEIVFGNYDENTAKGSGAVPPAGAQIRARTYRYVAGGSSGNIAAEQVSAQATTPDGRPLAGISKVTNLTPGFDGADEESIDDTLRRAPEVLKTRDRAVTAEDYEQLARAASTDVVTVRCLTPKLNADNNTPWTYAGLTRAPGSVYVIVAANQGPDEARPVPTPTLITEVKDYLDQRRDLTATLSVVGPRYVPIRVTATLAVWPEAAAGVDTVKLKSDTIQLIDAYLHPTRGGPNGTGWEPGQTILPSDLFRAIMPPENVGFIETLQLSTEIPLYHFPPYNAAGIDSNWTQKERPFPLTTDPAPSVRVADYETICAAADHQINVIPADGG